MYQTRDDDSRTRLNLMFARDGLRVDMNPCLRIAHLMSHSEIHHVRSSLARSRHFSILDHAIDLFLIRSCEDRLHFRFKICFQY